MEFISLVVGLEGLTGRGTECKLSQNLNENAVTSARSKYLVFFLFLFNFFLILIIRLKNMIALEYSGCACSDTNVN